MQLEESPEVYKVTDYDELLFSQVRGYFRRSERRRPSCVACPTSGSEELLFDAQKLCDEFQIDVIALQDKRLRQRWNEEFSRYTLSPGIARFLPARGSLCDEDDKLAVFRARKLQKFLSQPFHVAEVFTGLPGKFVPLKETIRGFKMIVDGEMDDYPENAFFNVGTIDEVVEKAKTMKEA